MASDLQLVNTSKWTITPVGIAFHDELDEAEWMDLGLRIGRVDGAMRWLIGDWAAAEGRVKNGVRSESYQQLEDMTGLSRLSIKHAKWVVEKFDLCRRRHRLSYSHHEEVASFPEDEQDRLLDWAEETNATRSQLRQKKREALPSPDIPSGKYRILYADPPWEYGAPQHTDGDSMVRSAGQQETVLETHYESMSTQEICALPVRDLSADDAVLFLWATSPLLWHAREVIEAWGFEYKASMIWDKVKHNVGYYVSVRHELLLIATKGSCLPDNRKLYDSVQTIERTEHSRKPERFREIIDDLYRDGPRIELFRRGDAPTGWEIWGNEAK